MYKRQELQFRLLRKNAEPIWVLDKGRYLQDEWGRQYFCCILVDISESKRIAEEFRLSLQRYEIIMNQTQDIIFEWNIPTDELTFSENWKQYLGYPLQLTVDVYKRQPRVPPWPCELNQLRSAS